MEDAAGQDVAEKLDVANAKQQRKTLPSRYSGLGKIFLPVQEDRPTSI